MDSKAQTHNTLSLILGNVTVTQDEEGRYSLNDLHNAAGGAAKHAPSRWIRSQQAIELVQVLEAELTNQKDVLTSHIWPVKTTEGRYGGTYVVKELAIDYAAWISADFRLLVIRGYEAMVMTGNGRNLSVEVKLTDWAKLVAMGIALMKSLALCADIGVARGQYGTLLQINRVCGLATLPLERLAPGVRQQSLLDEGDAA